MDDNGNGESRSKRQEWRAVAETIRAKLAQGIGPYITPSIGFGPNQVLAKIAAEMNKPNGLICLHPSQLPQALYPIDLADIPGIGRGMTKRLSAANIATVQQLMALSGKQMRSLWRSVEGERLWAGLHGYQLEKPKTQKRMFGHGRILSPDWRNRKGVRNCARLLLVKAARRLRRAGFAAGHMSVSIGFADKTRLRAEQKLCVPAIDDQSFLAGLEVLLAKLWQRAPNARPFKVSICLSGLVRTQDRCEDLLETPADRLQRRRWENLSALIDTANNHYARTMISVGTHIEPPGGYTGGKIAFGRIPDMKDFI